MRIRPLVVVLLAGLLLPSGAVSAGPVTQEPCAGTATPPIVWHRFGNDVLENLLFAKGDMWVSDGAAGGVVRVTPSRATSVVRVDSPGGLAEGPDGLIYVGRGSSLQNALGRTSGAGVVRFDAASPSPQLEVYAAGMHMANGMTFGPDGTLFASDDFNAGLYAIPAGGSASPPLVHEDVWGMNGLVVHPAGDNIYAAITFDQRSPIARLPLAGGEPEIAAQLSFGAVSLRPAVHTDGDASRPLVGLKGLDDMTRDADPSRTADDSLYVVANGMGELLRVRTSSGDACLVASGLTNPSSVRVAPEASTFADGDAATLDLYITEFSGAIKVVRYCPAC